jgi:hypothetical protein
MYIKGCLRVLNDPYRLPLPYYILFILREEMIFFSLIVIEEYRVVKLGRGGIEPPTHGFSVR